MRSLETGERLDPDLARLGKLTCLPAWSGITFLPPFKVSAGTPQQLYCALLKSSLGSLPLPAPAAGVGREKAVLPAAG